MTVTSLNPTFWKSFDRQKWGGDVSGEKEVSRHQTLSDHVLNQDPSMWTEGKVSWVQLDRWTSLIFSKTISQQPVVGTKNTCRPCYPRGPFVARNLDTPGVFERDTAVVPGGWSSDGRLTGVWQWGKGLSNQKNLFLLVWVFLLLSYFLFYFGFTRFKKVSYPHPFILSSRRGVFIVLIENKEKWKPQDNIYECNVYFRQIFLKVSRCWWMTPITPILERTSVLSLIMWIKVRKTLRVFIYNCIQKLTKTFTILVIH